MAPAPAVHFHAAVALAGRFPALSGVDLTVAPGEVVVVVGPNGAGKTSLLRACAGLLAVTSGEAEVLGHDLRHERADVRRRVGLLGHAAPLYDELTATENVRFAVRAAGLPAAAAAPALVRLGLVGRLGRTTVGRLSAGQVRRVALAALVARAPELWLLDEPHAGLDAGARRLLGELVAEAAAGGAAVLLSSHEPDLAVPLADRVVTMSGGQVTGGRPGGRRPVLSALGTEGVNVA
ncbi:MAG: heme ABC exporter ATP-binding protein CcmA [Acidimicrobiales bacterium]